MKYHGTKCQIGDLSRVIPIFCVGGFHTINFKLLHPMAQLMRNCTIYEELHSVHKINQSTLYFTKNSDVWVILKKSYLWEAANSL